MDHCRLNSPSTSAISIEVFGHKLSISQDPNSKHHGTTVWDASLVFVKYLEKNCRKGKFSPAKMKGKKVIELGAGCGLAGLGMCMLGCDVISTDQSEVLPLLSRNIDRNISYISQTNSDHSGSIKVCELDWGNKSQIESVGNIPFDYIIGTDIVYSEHLLEPLIQTILALSGPRTNIIIGYEIRSTVVHEQMIQMLKNYFNLKIIPKAKMDNKYQHGSIDLYSMNLKNSLKLEKEIKSEESSELISDEERDNEESENVGTSTEKEIEEFVPVPKSGTIDEWEIRRCGAMAARLLKDVKLK